MTFAGADPGTMDRMAGACVDGAKVLTEQAEALRRVKGWLFGPSAVVAIGYLRRTIVPMLERQAEALREAASVLTRHAQAQRDASAGKQVDFASLPNYRRRSLSAEERAVRGGVVQSVGGLIQIGGAALGASSGAGIPVAIAAGGLGVDNLVAGIRSIIDRAPHDTVVHQAAAGGARLAGASDKTADRIAFATETALGLSLGTGSTGLRGIGLSEEAARLAPNTVSVATRSGRTLEEAVLGHNMVGSKVESGLIQVGENRSAEAFGHVVKDPANGNVVSFEMRPGTTSETLARSGASVQHVAVPSAEEALQARQAMRTISDEFAASPQPWGLLGPNCTTAACDVLKAAGVDLPPTARLSPYLLNQALREFPYAGGPGGAIATGQGLGSAGTLDSHSGTAKEGK
jgi:hypothetical protein